MAVVRFTAETSKGYYEQQTDSILPTATLSTKTHKRHPFILLLGKKEVTYKLHDMMPTFYC